MEGNGRGVCPNYIDERYEFDAPQYFNFAAGETPDETAAAERWFSSSITPIPSLFRRLMLSGNVGTVRIKNVAGFSSPNKNELMLQGSLDKGNGNPLASSTLIKENKLSEQMQSLQETKKVSGKSTSISSDSTKDPEKQDCISGKQELEDKISIEGKGANATAQENTSEEAKPDSEVRLAASSVSNCVSDALVSLDNLETENASTILEPKIDYPSPTSIRGSSETTAAEFLSASSHFKAERSTPLSSGRIKNNFVITDADSQLRSSCLNTSQKAEENMPEIQDKDHPSIFIATTEDGMLDNITFEAATDNATTTLAIASSQEAMPNGSVKDSESKEGSNNIGDKCGTEATQKDLSGQGDKSSTNEHLHLLEEGKQKKLKRKINRNPNDMEVLGKQEQRHVNKRQKLERGMAKQVSNGKYLSVTKPLPSLTIPQEFHFHTEERFLTHRGAHCQAFTQADGSLYVPVAEQVLKFQIGRCDYHQENQSLKLTRPKEPDLMTSHRARPTRIKSSAELEEEMIANRPQFKARPLNKRILEAPTLPSLTRSTPQLPEFLEFNLRTAERAFQHMSNMSNNTFNPCSTRNVSSSYSCSSTSAEGHPLLPETYAPVAFARHVLGKRVARADEIVEGKKPLKKHKHLSAASDKKTGCKDATDKENMQCASRITHNSIKCTRGLANKGTSHTKGEIDSTRKPLSNIQTNIPQRVRDAKLKDAENVYQKSFTQALDVLGTSKECGDPDVVDMRNKNNAVESS